MIAFKTLRASAALLFGVALLAGSALAQSRPATSGDPYGGVTVEDIIARVNDQIITNSDYQRAMNEMDKEARQRGESMQQMADEHKNLLRSLIDQQLWLSKGKELGITGETDLIKRLDEIRKQYHLATIEDLEKAAKEQGVSFEDFKANIRNQIVTQNVMRQEVGRTIQITPGEARQYYEQHKQDYMEPESVHLSEILISTGSPDTENAAELAAAKAKAEDIEARLHAGGDFTQLARSFSNGSTASAGGNLGQYKRGELPKELEDKTFSLKAGQYTEPILTRQGYIILKVTQHTMGGVQPYSAVENQVEDALYMSRMEPAIRAYLTKMREEAYIDIRPGYVDTGASPNETKPIYSAYVPPSPKKRKKVERTRFRETARTFRQKSRPDEAASAQAPAEAKKVKEKKSKKTELATEKPGKKEKIRFGQAPRETLPPATNATVENGGAMPETAVASAQVPEDQLEQSAPPERKSRFSDRARKSKKEKAKAKQPATFTPAAPDAAEVADRQTQSAPLGLAGDTSKKKKVSSVTGEKTRLSDEMKKPKSKQTKVIQFTPAPQEPGAPAPASHPDTPQPQPQQ